MEAETSLPVPQSNASAPAAAPSAEQPSALQAATEQPATEQPASSDQPAAAQQAETADQAQPMEAAVEAQQVGASVQQQTEDAADAAAPTANGMQEQHAPLAFTSGTVLRFDMDADDVGDSTTLDFRAIRPVFGGKEGGVRHCEYRRVRCQFVLPQACITYVGFQTASSLVLDAC